MLHIFFPSPSFPSFSCSSCSHLLLLLYYFNVNVQHIRDTSYTRLSTLLALSFDFSEKKFSFYVVVSLVTGIIQMKIKNSSAVSKAKKFANARDGVGFLNLEPGSFTRRLCHLSCESRSEPGYRGLGTC